MFYAHYVLTKKGPLARIWLAAHWDKKLTKAHVFETNIGNSVEAIMEPKVKLALRTTGHLLLGVVRIYSRKAKYLLADCNEAFVKIKMAFRPGVVDLPEENREAAVATITLPETFHDFETTMPDLSDVEVQAQFSVNQSRPEEITMREDLGNITLVGDDGFGDIGFDGRMIQDAQMDDTLYVKNADTALLGAGKDRVEKPMDIDFVGGKGDDFGGAMSDFEGPAGVEDDDDDDDNEGHDNFGPVDTELFEENFEAGGLFEEPPPVPDVPLQTDIAEQQRQGDKAQEETLENIVATHSHVEHTTSTLSTIPDQTTLIPNEAEAFALEPIDITTIGTERKGKRKRKLIIDEQKGIPSDTMKLQLADTSDIVTTLDLAPPTKKLMHWKETGGVEKLFALSGRTMMSKKISKLFNCNLVTKAVREEDEEQLDLDQHEQQKQQLEKERERVECVQPPLPEEVELPRVAEQSAIGEQIEAPSLVEEPSHLRMSVAGPEDQSVAEPSLAEPSFQAPEATFSAPNTPGLPSAPSSSEDEADAFDEELPPEPEQAEQDLEEAEDGEDADERRWTKRTQQLLHILSRHFDEGESASFSQVVARNNRKQVASKFYTLLVLKKHKAIEVAQTEAYGDIIIDKGPQYGEVF